MHAGDGICKGQGVKVMSILLILIDKMPKAALQGKAIRQQIKAMYNICYWLINHGTCQACQAFFPLLLKTGIFRKILWICEGFQLYRSLLATIIGIKITTS